MRLIIYRVEYIFVAHWFIIVLFFSSFFCVCVCCCGLFVSIFWLFGWMCARPRIRSSWTIFPLLIHFKRDWRAPNSHLFIHVRMHVFGWKYLVCDTHFRIAMKWKFMINLDSVRKWKAIAHYVLILFFLIHIISLRIIVASAIALLDAFNARLKLVENVIYARVIRFSQCMRCILNGE